MSELVAVFVYDPRLEPTMCPRLLFKTVKNIFGGTVALGCMSDMYYVLPSIFIVRYMKFIQPVTGRRNSHSGRGEDFLTGQPDFFTETAVTLERKVEKWFPRWEINRHAEG